MKMVDEENPDKSQGNSKNSKKNTFKLHMHLYFVISQLTHHKKHTLDFKKKQTS